MHAHFRMIKAVEHGLHKEWMDGATLPALVKVGERARLYIQLEDNVSKFLFNDQLRSSYGSRKSVLPAENARGDADWMHAPLQMHHKRS